MNLDTDRNRFDYMKGPDYMDALFAGKHLILAIILVSVAITAIYSYSYLPRNTVYAVVKPGSFVGSDGNITPVITPEGLSSVIKEGVFNGLIQQSLPTASRKPLQFNAFHLQDTDTVKITYETDNASLGIRILKELVDQLSTYYEKERAFKLNTISSKYMDGLKSQWLAAESSRIKKTEERNSLVHERTLMKKTLLTAQQKKGEIEEKIKNKEGEIAAKQREINIYQQDSLILSKQMKSLDNISKDGRPFQIIQEPLMMSTDFTEKFIQNTFISAIFSLVFAVLIQFVIYDLKLGQRRII